MDEIIEELNKAMSIIYVEGVVNLNKDLERALEHLYKVKEALENETLRID